MKQYIKNFPSVFYSRGASSRILHRYPNLGRLKWWHVRCQSISINSMDTLCVFVFAAKKGSWIPYVAKDDLPKCKDYRNVSPYPGGFFAVLLFVCLLRNCCLKWVQIPEFKSSSCLNLLRGGTLDTCRHTRRPSARVLYVIFRVLTVSMYPTTQAM